MGTGQLQTGGGRNYSIDLLRIISMFMIMILHCNSHGGVLAMQTGYDTSSIFFHFLECLSIVSVNTFVLISGYYLSAQKIRLSRVLKVMTTTWFYAWIWLLICILLGVEIGKATIIKNIAPLSYATYWFVSLYIGMFLCAPFLNIDINNMTKRQHGILVLMLIAIFSVLPSITPFSDTFGLKSSGLNLPWFIVLYIIAAYIQKYGFLKMKPWHWLAGYLGLSVILLFIWLTISKILGISDYTDEWKGGINFYYFGYNTIFVLLSSVCLFRFFLEIKIGNKRVCTIIKTIAPLMIGVYLIHDNRLGRQFVWQAFSNLGSSNFVNTLYILGYILVLFVLCVNIEWLRTKVFLLLEKRNIYKKLLGRVDKLPDFFYDKMLHNK